MMSRRIWKKRALKQIRIGKTFESGDIEKRTLVELVSNVAPNDLRL